MKVLESLLNIQSITNLPCADLYFTDDIVIAEVNQHVIIGVEEAQVIMKAIEDEIGDISRVHYISNRVYDYSLKPAELTNIKNRLDKFKSYSVVTYTKAGMTILVFERMFLKKTIARYSSLKMAIEAAGVLNSVNDNKTSVA
ncbi:hypothetical protein [Nonlabens antarcticus]|uniref:hypothetical protein n=1 Tax=Nonlabens antarcticus TaxID=392714 RepID=UPI001890CBC0|nr:hypothetical protein [Nonlabens antarcticus]